VNQLSAQARSFVSEPEVDPLDQTICALDLAWMLDQLESPEEFQELCQNPAYTEERIDRALLLLASANHVIIQSKNT
ncbi:MAG: hypothetical protein ACRC80_29555, partial [Waterburya sp.]